MEMFGVYTDLTDPPSQSEIDISLVKIIYLYRLNIIHLGLFDLTNVRVL